jgi:hypothetical protein
MFLRLLWDIINETLKFGNEEAGVYKEKDRPILYIPRISYADDKSTKRIPFLVLPSFVLIYHHQPSTSLSWVDFSCIAHCLLLSASFPLCHFQVEGVVHASNAE